MVAAGSGIVTVMKDKPAKPVQHSTEQVVAPVAEPTPEATTSEAPAETTPAPATAEPAKPVATSSVVLAPTPTYGLSPNDPNSYIVFDKAAVMNAAGIPAGQQPAVLDTLAQINPNWVYKQINPAQSWDDLCNAIPKVKMASAGADYDTNPVTQAKWCHSYVLAKYGSWDAALERAKVSHSI